MDLRRGIQDQDLLLLVKGNFWRGSINTMACSPGAFIWHYEQQFSRLATVIVLKDTLWETEYQEHTDLEKMSVV